MAMTKTGEPLDLSAPIATDTPGWVTDFAGNARKINDFARATENKIGDITTLQTECKDNLVGAVNEVINTIPDLGGTNILNATNEQIVLGTTAQWSKRTWRSSRSPQSGVDPEGTSTAISIDDSPNPHIKYGFELNTVTGRIMVAQDGVPFIIGKIYTLSCYARATNGTGKLLLQVGGGAEWKAVVKDVTDDWQKYYMTFSTKKKYCNVYFGNDGVNSTLQVCGCKLEVGDYATDWSYSPNDIDARNAEKLDKSKVIESTEITEPGFVMDGKTCSAALAELNSKLSGVLTLASGVKNASSTDTSYVYKRGHKACLFLDITATFSGENNIYATLPVGFRPSRIIRFSGTAGTSYWNASNVVSFMVYPDTGYVTGVCSSATSNTKYARGYIEFDID